MKVVSRDRMDTTPQGAERHARSPPKAFRRPIVGPLGVFSRALRLPLEVFSRALRLPLEREGSRRPIAKVVSLSRPSPPFLTPYRGRSTALQELRSNRVSFAVKGRVFATPTHGHGSLLYHARIWKSSAPCARTEEAFVLFLGEKRCLLLVKFADYRWFADGRRVA
ncbi:uncharacterized protein SCHCODRAFT_02097344 [Schizophyllum commune H4-8]|uniref:uncharacterized protein n=1 Tax=Schizophyllum commune (strain H4-8 / FGSC 9210) TaxID=578458 RepID=UPI00216074B7|nr:uncharacterized protein SCHCODRAFT_02097344 [Schizophyllum commune H4-8]KAI5886397.1 hypothetical protein SCHCODRAFT_02097344 [Schizophyllum commune H4-8]